MHGKNYHDASGKVTSPVAIATALPLQKKVKEKQGRCPHPLSLPPSTSRSVSFLSNHLHHHLHQNSFPSFAITRTRPFIASEVPCYSASRRYHSGLSFLLFFLLFGFPPISGRRTFAAFASRWQHHSIAYQPAAPPARCSISRRRALRNTTNLFLYTTGNTLKLTRRHYGFTVSISFSKTRQSSSVRS